MAVETFKHKNNAIVTGLGLLIMLAANLASGSVVGAVEIDNSDCDFAYTADKKAITGTCEHPGNNLEAFPKFSKETWTKTSPTSYTADIKVAGIDFRGSETQLTCTSTITIGQDKTKGTLKGKIPVQALNLKDKRDCESVNKSVPIDVNVSNSAKPAQALASSIIKSTAEDVKKYCDDQPDYRRTATCEDSWKSLINSCSQSVLQDIVRQDSVGSGGLYDGKTLSKAGLDVFQDQMAYCVSQSDSPYWGGKQALATRLLTDNVLNKANKSLGDVKLDEVATTSEDVAGDGTTCAIDGIGWIVCPVMTFMAKLNDSAFAFLKNMLDIRPALVMDKSTREAWSAFRDIANVAFVIAFMAIVYSQLTSAGISNYGVKRMLPRLFIAAILVNASFWVTALAVDLSNIVGSNIYSLLGTSIDVGTGPASGGETWSDIVGAILMVAAGVLLVVAVVLAPTVLLALAVILLILVARQALVIMLIVLAPLAFVAYLLPNTEDWFKKWYKMFVAVLMVYPIVAIVFGASTLASKILMNVAGGGSGDDEQLLKIVALAVLAIPLFAVPALLKGSMSAAGSVGAKLSGMADRTNRSAMSKGRQRFDKTALGQFKNYRSTERDKRRAMIQAGAYSGNKKNPLNWRRNAASKISGGIAASSMSGKFGDRMVAQGYALADKEWDEEVGRQKTSMTSMDHSELLKIMRDKSATAERRAAAAGTIMGRDFREGQLQALEAAGQLGREGDKEVGGIQKQMAHDMKDKPFALGDQAAGQLGIGTYGKAQPPRPDGSIPPQLGDLNTELAQRVGEKLSAANLAGMNPDELKRMYAMAENRNKSEAELDELRQQGKVAEQLDDTQLANFQNAILEARSNDLYKNNIKPEAAKLHDRVLQLGNNTPSQSTQAQTAQPASPTSSSPRQSGSQPLPPIDHDDDSAGVL